MTAPLAIKSLALSVVTLLKNSVNAWLCTHDCIHRHTLHLHNFTDCFSLQSYCDYMQNKILLDYKLEVFCTYTTSTTNYIGICISKNLLYVNSLFSTALHKMITLLNSMIDFFFFHFVNLQRISRMVPILVLEKFIWGGTKKFSLKCNLKWLKRSSYQFIIYRRADSGERNENYCFLYLYSIFILWYQWDIPKSNWLSCVSYLHNHYNEIVLLLLRLRLLISPTQYLAWI